MLAQVWTFYCCTGKIFQSQTIVGKNIQSRAQIEEVVTEIVMGKEFLLSDFLNCWSLYLRDSRKIKHFSRKKNTYGQEKRERKEAQKQNRKFRKNREKPKKIEVEEKKTDTHTLSFRSFLFLFLEPSLTDAIKLL